MSRRNPDRAARPVDLVDYAAAAAVEVIDLVDEGDVPPVVQHAPTWPTAEELQQGCVLCLGALGARGPPVACPVCGNAFCLACVQELFAHGAGTIGRVSQCPIARCEVRDAAGQWLPGLEFRPVTAELMRLHAALRERDEVRAVPLREALGQGLAAVPEEHDDGESVADEAEEVEEDGVVVGADAAESDGDVVDGDFSDEEVRVNEDGVDGGIVAPRELVQARGATPPGLGDNDLGLVRGADSPRCEGVVAERPLWTAGRRLVPSRFRGPDGVFRCPECHWHGRHRGHAREHFRTHRFSGIYEEFEAEGRWSARGGRARRERRRRRVRGVLAFHIEEDDEVVFSDAE